MWELFKFAAQYLQTFLGLIQVSYLNIAKPSTILHSQTMLNHQPFLWLKPHSCSCWLHHITSYYIPMFVGPIPITMFILRLTNHMPAASSSWKFHVPPGFGRAVPRDVFRRGGKAGHVPRHAHGLKATKDDENAQLKNGEFLKPTKVRRYHGVF